MYNYSGILYFCFAFWPQKPVFLIHLGGFGMTFCGIPTKKIRCLYFEKQRFSIFERFFLKKYFASIEKGCIFASAFDEKTGC